MDHTREIDRLNRATWDSSERTAEYTEAAYVFEAERILLARIAGEVRGGRLLELGCGGGRLTPHLLALSADYLGLDYAEGMVQACRRKFPGVEFRREDARDVDALPSAAYSLVVFAFNGIDCVDHGDRQRVLSAIHRVLRPGGILLFSSHNYRWAVSHPFAPLPANQHLEVRGDGWAVLNNPVYGSAFLTHYTTVAEACRELSRFGFAQPAAVLDADGREYSLPLESDAPWLYYCVRKPSASPRP